MQPRNMNVQRGLDLLLNVLLACSRLRHGGEQTRPDGTEKESRRLTAPSLFCTCFPNFANPHMISDSEPNVLLGLEP